VLKQREGTHVTGAVCLDWKLEAKERVRTTLRTAVECALVFRVTASVFVL
jgi:hypothetical protein